MICPKCQSQMRTFDKSGVHIDQCQGCRGVFLDHGELERILSAESAFYGNAATPPPYQAQGAPPAGYQSSGWHGYSDSPRPYHGHRRKSFLEQLFD